MMNNNAMLMYNINAQLQNSILDAVKVFKNKFGNLLVQYFALKVILGMNMTSIYNEIKKMFMMFYYKYFKRLFNWGPRTIKFDVIYNPGTMSGRIGGLNAGYMKPTTSMDGTSTDLTTNYGDMWIINSTARAILWRLNSLLKKNDYIKSMEHTNMSYINEHVNGSHDCTESIFIPDHMVGINIGDEILVDIVPSDKAVMSTGYAGVNKTDDNRSKYIKVYSWKKSLEELKRFCNELLKVYNNDIDKKTLNVQKIFIYKSHGKKESTPSNPYALPSSDMLYTRMSRTGNSCITGQTKDWIVNNFETNKCWDSLFIEDKENVKGNIYGIVNYGDEFSKRIGQPRHLTILAHGCAGCGKNSFFKVLAKHVFPDKHIVVIPPGSITCFDDWEAIVNSDMIGGINVPHDKRIYQLEEIDKSIKDIKRIDQEEMRQIVKNELAQGKEGKNFDFERYFATRLKVEKDVRNKELGKWLNYFDGPFEQPDRTIFMTANDLNELNKLFLRDGRITMTLDFKLATAQLVREIVMNIFEYVGGDKEIDTLMTELKDYVHSHAHVYKVCTNNITNFKDYSKNRIYIVKSLSQLLDEQNMSDGSNSEDISSESMDYEEQKAIERYITTNVMGLKRNIVSNGNKYKDKDNFLTMCDTQPLRDSDIVDIQTDPTTQTNSAGLL